MSYKGTVRDGNLELDQPIRLPSGTVVEVEVQPLEKPARGSAQALLQIAGRLTNEEAEAILVAAQTGRKVDPRLWE